MAKQLVDPDKIILFSIRILKAHFEVNEEVLDQPKETLKFDLGLKSETAFNLEEKNLRFRVYISIEGADKDDKPNGIRGEYDIEFHYHIENLDEFVIKGDKSEEIFFRDDLGGTIAGISYSTARGIILDRTQATDLNGIILPVINPYNLLEEDITYKKPIVKKSRPKKVGRQRKKELLSK